MNHVRLGALAAALALAVGFGAHADPIRYRGPVTLPNGVMTQGEVDVSTSNPLPVAATVSASIAAFNPTGNATLSASTTSARVALPSADKTALIRNTGTSDAWLAFGDATVTAGLAGTLLPAGQGVAFNVGSGTYVAAITASGTSSLAISTGTGLPAMTGGGGSGGGGGGAITAASGAYAAGAFSLGSAVDGWNVTLGTKNDAANCGVGNTEIACLRQLHTDLTGVVPTPSNIATAQVSVGTTATQVVAARSGRQTATITNTTTTALYCGSSGVTTSTGEYIVGVAGASWTLASQAAIYCVVASGTATVSEVETY